MFKPVIVTSESVKSVSQPLPTEAVNNIFKVLHGFYGNLFLSKFATGVVVDDEDQGIVGARGIWGHGLREFDPGTVKQALARCMQAHPEFPPSLPQFAALCRACAPRAVTAPEAPAIGMSQELRSRYAAQARAINREHDQRSFDKRTGFRELPQNLDGLKQAIADAVGCAGGDAAAELVRLDRLCAPRGRAA